MSDENLLDLLQNPTSRERGFRALMEQYQAQMYWQVRRLVLDHDDTDDILQNTFIKVFKGISKFEHKSKLSTWLYRIAINESLTFLEGKKRHVAQSLDENAALAAQLIADKYFDGDAIEVKLQQAIQKLPDKQRIVFNMRYFDETPYEEMSAILDTSVGALKASYHHAVKKVENFLSEK
jgi:RNA polymerase sigma-70 factor, ECF subfamily